MRLSPLAACPSLGGSLGHPSPALLPSAMCSSAAATVYHPSSTPASPAMAGDQWGQRIRQLTTPVNNSRDDALEVVTVYDPTHPLYGRRFRVASRPTRPDAQGTHLLVFLRDTIQLRLPLRVTLPVSTEQTVTKLTPTAVAELIATAQACGIWQSDPPPCGASSPMRSNRPSCPISTPLSAR